LGKGQELTVRLESTEITLASSLGVRHDKVTVRNVDDLATEFKVQAALHIGIGALN
jgi:hypothetical protein